MLLVFFQNCSRVGFENHDAPTAAVAQSGGQGYDGKPFVTYGRCADETLVVSRIILNDATKGTLVRENCSNVEPLELRVGDFSLDSSDETTLTYKNQTYTREIIPFSKMPALTAYYQWSNSPRVITTPGIFMIDVNATAVDLASLKSAGHTVICMITAGVTGSRDADFAAYSAGDIGRAQAGAPTAYWLDTRSPNVRAVMLTKLRHAYDKGCAGVLWDQTDAHLSNSGFPLTAATSLDFAKFLALASHDRRMPVVLSNTGDLSSRLVDYFDMQYSENCNQSGSCGRFKRFADQGKPVLISDSGNFSQALCTANRSQNFTLWFSTQNGDGSRYQPCP